MADHTASWIVKRLSDGLDDDHHWPISEVFYPLMAVETTSIIRICRRYLNWQQLHQNKDNSQR